jgi:DNA polymerase
MLFADLETFSHVDIKVAALDRYASDPSTRILMCAYADIEGPIDIWQEGEPLPARLKSAFYGGTGEDVVAWNKGFEETVLEKCNGVTGIKWRDAMVAARYAGLPAGLKSANKVPFFSGQAVTSKESRLIALFCKPNKDGTVNNRTTHPAEWEEFCQYCKDDVQDTRLIWKWCLKNFPAPVDAIWRRAWHVDQAINRRGLPIDVDMCEWADKEATRLQAEAHERLKELTGLENPNSVKQLLEWVSEPSRGGYPYNGLGKELVKRFVDDPEVPECEAKAALRLRLDGAKAAVKKFPKILETISPDERLRQQYSFYGAHTGRWSGRGAQPQNLKAPRTPEDKALTKQCVKLLEAHLPAPSLHALSFMGRPLIKAPKGKKVVISDFKSVENRVLAWVACCESMLEVYAQGKDPYIDFATKLWDLPYEEISAEQRQLAKPGTLGCGFGLGGGKEKRIAKCTACKHSVDVGADSVEGSIFDCPKCFARTCKVGPIVRTGLWRYAQMMGIDLTQEQAAAQVQIFRTAFAEVQELWYYLEEAYVACVQTKLPQKVGCLTFIYREPALRIVLPSGRELVYMNPWAYKGRNERGFQSVTMGFEGVKGNAWMRQSTYGGRLCENVIQAIAADLLVEALFLAEADARLEVILHSHDEIGALADNADITAKQRLEEYMSRTPTWAPGLIMAADGNEAERYAKAMRRKVA